MLYFYYVPFRRDQFHVKSLIEYHRILILNGTNIMDYMF